MTEDSDTTPGHDPKRDGPDPKLVADLAVALVTKGPALPLPDSRTMLDLEPSILDSMRRERQTAEATVEEMRRHLHGTTRHLAHARGLDPSVSRRLLRLEVDRDTEPMLYAAEYSSRQMMGRYHPLEREGPMQLDGFDCYVVNKLPEADKGWRVINPFEAKR